MHARAHHSALSPQVREELHSLRGKDEEAELLDEAEAARSQQLSLQPLYAKPPPVWLHPAFAAEVGDAFIAGTGLDGGSLHISLEVVVLTLQRLLTEPHGAACSLPHAQRAALNTTCTLLEDAKKLAHKLAHAMGHQGQQRMYLSKALKALEALEPGGMLVLPCAVGGGPLSACDCLRVHVMTRMASLMLPLIACQWAAADDAADDASDDL